jgi:RNA polymerase sigma-70 factor (ECF subfamily)
MGLRQADAEDVAQETFVAFSESFRKGSYNRAEGRLSKWLFGVALKQTLNAKRRILTRERRHDRSKDSRFLTALPDRRSARTAWEEEWQRAVLHDCVRRARLEFSEQSFQCFNLVVFFGQSPHEVARTLHTTVRAVYNAKHRILKRVRQMREAYERYGSADGPRRALR